MKSLKANFQKIKLAKPYWTDYICIAYTVRQKHFDNQIIKKNFEILVNSKEYDINDKKQILHFLYELTNSKPTEASSLGVVKSPENPQIAESEINIPSMNFNGFKSQINKNFNSEKWTI